MHRERGFTLLEVLVAFAIAALALIALYSAVLDGLRNTFVAGHMEQAIALARSRLAAVGSALPLTAGDRGGDDGRGFHWQVRIRNAGMAPAGRTDAGQMSRVPQVTLYAVSVIVSWTREGARQVRLDTARASQTIEGAR
jgi:general secretion pathway protein I